MYRTLFLTALGSVWAAIVQTKESFNEFKSSISAEISRSATIIATCSRRTGRGRF